MGRSACSRRRWAARSITGATPRRRSGVALIALTRRHRACRPKNLHESHRPWDVSDGDGTRVWGPFSIVFPDTPSPLWGGPRWARCLGAPRATKPPPGGPAPTRSDIGNSCTRRSRAGYWLRLRGPIPGNGRGKKPPITGVESPAIDQNDIAGERLCRPLRLAPPSLLGNRVAGGSGIYFVGKENLGVRLAPNLKPHLMLRRPRSGRLEACATNKVLVPTKSAEVTPR